MFVMYHKFCEASLRVCHILMYCLIIFLTSCAFSVELMCEWDKSQSGNNGNSIIPGSNAQSVSISFTTPSSIKSAKYYYEKSIEEIVYIATLQNKIQSLRKQYAKLRKLKLANKQNLIDLKSPKSENIVEPALSNISDFNSDSVEI